MPREHVGSFNGVGIIAVHRGADRDEMQVVAVVHHRVDARRVVRPDIGAVCRCRVFICLDRGCIVSGANVDMRRHVHDVPGSGRHRRQSVGSRECALRRFGSFNGVNVVVDRSQVIGIAFYHRLQRGDNFFRAGFGAAVLMPQAPRMQIHAGLGKQCRGVEIVRIALHYFAHRVVVLFRSLAPVRFRVGGEAKSHGVDICLLARRGVAFQMHRFLNGFMRLLKALFARRIVVVRPDGLGDSPKSHRKFGIEFCCFLKRPRRLIVIEGVNETQSLIEKLLRLRVLG